MTTRPSDDEELLTKTQLIEAQPLADRAALFESVYEELVEGLQRSDHDPGAE